MNGLLGRIAAAIAALGALLFAVGMTRSSRPLKILGATLALSMGFSFILDRMGLPVFLLFGFLGTGGFFTRRGGPPPDGPGEAR